MSSRHDIALEGCRPEPLASYLKGLAVLRLVAEQVDPDARGWWRGDAFVLRSTLDREALLAFFLEQYAPTPIVVPWGGAAGFFFEEGKTNEKDASGKKIKTGVRNVATEATRLLSAVEESRAPRFAELRSAIKTSRAVLEQMGLHEAPTDEVKHQLIARLRSVLSDAAVAWMDATVFMTSARLEFPPLLGTGGNDGKLSFVKQMMKLLVDLFELDTGSPKPLNRPWLEAALFDTPHPGLVATVVGQFDPGAWGGLNAGPGFEGAPRSSPWDLVLLLEGTLLFGAAATRRAESNASRLLSVPFTVRPRGVDYATASISDESKTRAEMWLPLWRTPAGLRELRALFSEGRATIAGRRAESATDFARAVASLGVDRGLSSFARYGFQLRAGKMYIAAPLGRWFAGERGDVDLLVEIDEWLHRFRRMATAANAPASLGRAARRLDTAILALCRRGARAGVLDVLLALGEAEAAMSRSLGHVLADANRVPPVPLLKRQWLDRLELDDPDLRLAASLASAGYRERIVRVRLDRGRPEWQPSEDGRTTWSRDLERSLLATLIRQEVERSQGRRPVGRFVPSLFCDIASFISGETDDARLEAALRGLSLLDWNLATPHYRPRAHGRLPPAAWAVLVLARDPALPMTPGLLAAAACGDARTATERAIRRLRGAGIEVPRTPLVEPTTRTRRIAAALALPVSSAQRRELAAALVRPNDTPSAIEPFQEPTP